MPTIYLSNCILLLIFPRAREVYEICRHSRLDKANKTGLFMVILSGVKKPPWRRVSTAEVF